MDSIQIKDKQFTVSIKEQDIQKEVIRVANEINRDLADKNPLFLSVLNGSFMFTADLLKHITIPCEISFVKLASYQGVTSTGVIKEVIGLNEDIAGRTVVIVEDIVDTGLTMQRLLETLGTRNPESIHIASLYIFIHLLLSKDCNLSLYPRQENQMKIRNPLPTIPALSKAFGSFSCNVRKERDRFSPCSFPCRHPPVLYESDTVFLTHAFYPCSG